MNEIPWWRTDLGEAEVESAARALRGRHVNQGPLCREFEERLAARLGVPHVVAVTNGSQAVLMTLLACGVGPGDEVIVPAFTFIASAHAAMLLGATVRLVDVRRDRPLIDVEQVERAITRRAKVIMAVHLNGRACEMGALNQMAARRGVRMVEDAAQAFCSEGPGGMLGAQSAAGAFALDMTKIITTGEGGFVATRDAATHERLLKLRNQGVLLAARNVFDSFGFNFKFPDVLAAIGLAQMERLDAHIAAVRRVNGFYEEELAGLRYLRTGEMRVRGGELPLWAEVLCMERDKVVSLMRERGIVVRPLPPSLSESKHLGALGSFPNAEFFGRHGLILPCGPDQPDGDLRRVVAALREIEGEVAAWPGGGDA